MSQLGANDLVKMAEGASKGSVKGIMESLKPQERGGQSKDGDNHQDDSIFPADGRVEFIYKVTRRRPGGPGRGRTGASYGALRSNAGDWPFKRTKNWFEETKAKIVSRFGPGYYDMAPYSADGKKPLNDPEKYPTLSFEVESEDEAMDLGWEPPETGAGRLSLGGDDSDAPAPIIKPTEAQSQLAEMDLEIKKEEKRISLEETKAEAELRRRSIEKRLNGQDDKADKEKERDVREALRERDRAVEDAARVKAEAEIKAAKAEAAVLAARAQAEAETAKVAAASETSLAKFKMEAERAVESERLRAETASLRNEVNSKFEALIAHLNRPQPLPPPPPPPPPPLDITALIGALTPLVGTLATAATQAFSAINAKVDSLANKKQPDMLELLKAAKDIVAPAPVSTQQTKLSELRDLVEVAKGLMPAPAPQVDPMEQLSRSFEMIQMAREMAAPPEDKPEEHTAVSIIKAVGGAVSQAARESGLVNALVPQPPQPPPGFPPGGAMIPHPQTGQPLTQAQVDAIRAAQAQRQAAQQPQQPGQPGVPIVPPAPVQELVLTPKELGEVAVLITDAINNGKPAKDVIARLKKKYPAAVEMLKDVESPEQLERDLTEAAGIVGVDGAAVMMCITALKSPAGQMWALEAAAELDL